MGNEQKSTATVTLAGQQVVANETGDSKPPRKFRWLSVALCTLMALTPVLSLAQQRATDEIIRLQPADAVGDDFNGDAVSVWGNRLLIGAPGDDDLGASSGSVYVYEYNGANWVETDKLVAPDGQASDRFGDAVSLQGDRAVIGALLGDGTAANTGAAYVFEFDGLDWQFIEKLTAADGAQDDHFGVAVDQDGDLILVGADSDDDLGGQSGSAYFFELQAGSWVQLPKLTASDGDAIAQFGAAVSVDGNRAAIGAPGDDEISIISGAGYVFERIAGVWQETDKLLASDGALGDALGTSAGVAGDRVILGAPGSGGIGAVYAYSFDGVDWNQDQRLVGSDLITAQGQLFGNVVALRGNQFVVGAPAANGPVSLSGTAYRFELVGGAWQEADILNANDASAQDRLGAAVDLFGSRYVVGADQVDGPGNEAGAAYVFQDEADLVLTLTAPASVVAGTALNYSLQVTNNGPSTALNVVLDHALAPAVAADSISAPCAGGFPCALGDLAMGASVTVDLTFTTPSDSAGVFNIQAAVVSDTVEAGPGDESVDNNVTVAAEADISVTKTGPSAAAPGATLVYQLVVENTGPSQAVRVTLNDTPVTGLMFVSAQAPCEAGFPCDLGTLDVAASTMVEATFQVMPGFTGTATNSASVSSTVDDPNAANNSDTADTFIGEVVDLAVVKLGPAQITAGATAQYQITVTNLSAVNASGVTLQDPTPAGLTFQSASAPCTGGFPCDLGTVNGSGVVNVDVTYSVASDVSGTLTNTASVSSLTQDSDPNNNSDSAQSTVVADADLALSVTGTSSPVAGDFFTLDFVLTNNGPSDAQNARVLTVGVVAPANIVSGTGPCTGGVPCALGTLAAGASVSFSVTFITDSSTTGGFDLTFDSTSDTDDANTTNNQQTLSFNLVIASDIIVVEKRDGTAHLEAGETTNYFITVDSQGPSDAVDVRVTDIIPAGLENVVWSCNTHGGGDCETSNGTGDVDVLVNLPFSVFATIQVIADVSATVQEGDVIINRASASVPAGATDPVPQNNSAEDRNVIGLFSDSFEDGT